MNRSRNYYTTVQHYHDLAEASHERQMFDAALLAPYASDGLVLDVAAGTGFNAQFLSLAPSRYVATDFSLTGLTHVTEKGRGLAVVSDCGLLPFRDATFDVILCSWSLEHFTNPNAVLAGMARVAKPGGRIMIWGPNWDNIFRKDFPQFSHRSRATRELIRWKIFFRMVRNEFTPFRYDPYVTENVAAFVHPDRYVSNDFDAVHCVLCQETVQWFLHHGGHIVFLADFSDMTLYVHNSLVIRVIRSVLRPFLPILRTIPFLRWFVIRFPVVVEVP